MTDWSVERRSSTLALAGVPLTASELTRGSKLTMSSIRGLPDSWTWGIEVREQASAMGGSDNSNSRLERTSSIAMRHHSHMTSGDLGFSAEL